MASQNGRRALRDKTGGRPGDRSLCRVDRLDRRFPVFVIAHLGCVEVLRRPIEFTQYASAAYRALLDAAGFAQSMSRTGDCRDNAVVESFFATLTKELLADGLFECRSTATRELFEFIEIWYNRQRRHSSLGYRSPMQYEAEILKVS